MMTDKYLALLEKAVRYVIKKEHGYFILLYGFILKKRVRTAPPPAKEYSWSLLSSDNIEADFDYRDESWNEIIHLGARGCLEWSQMNQVPFPSNLCTNSRVVFFGNSLRVRSGGGAPNRWVFLRFLHKVGCVYAIEHSLTINSEFTEVQFAFNIRSMMNRVRWIILDNRELIFQTVEKGAFIKPVFRKPLRLILGQKYQVRMEVVNNSFYYYIDGEIVASLTLDGHTAQVHDECALIFWEQGSERQIDATLENLRVWRGEKLLT